MKLFPSDVAPPPNEADVAQVLVHRVRLERTRQLGPALLGLALWRQLRLDEFFEARVDAAPADVPWSRVAAILAINRLCAPGSELAIEERWYPTTALDDLLHIPGGAINDSRLYRTLDHLLPHKTALERHLTARYGELFAAEFDVLLYDLTSSYVEGAAPNNPMMRRGYSRDHRPDCLQVILAVIVNVAGFPLSYETFDGNRADVTTLETVMRMVERKYGHARRVWVFDRGIVSDANLAAIRRRGGQYLVGTRRTALRHVERALLEGPWTQVRDEVEAQLLPIPGGAETYVLCRSTARREKELAAIRPLFHQLERRVKAHVLVAFLGYALWVTLKHLLHRRGTGLTPTHALAQLATLQSADIVLPTTDGREIRLRRVTQPTPDQQQLLDQLEITIPTHLEWNAECSADLTMS